ncbi:penicillin-binding transpeptidase domain-containing protein [Balneola sp. MJW-20]|uniref:penicillin-binding transpeptidase domain-containing protein n=1 Tax=Gracilimonas aurantiaca TaxID=3234185 RepID=UPI0034673417
MDHRSAILGRMFIVLGFVLLIPFALGFQLFRLNFLEGDGLRTLWSKQATESIKIPAQRGNIYDAKGTLLATNAVDYKIAVDPKIKGFNDAHIRQISNKLAELSGQSSSVYYKKFKDAPEWSRYIVLDKNLSVLDKDEIEKLDIPGLIIEENYRRKYTFGTLASHALGFVNHEMNGRTGLESFYNDQLRGTDGSRIVRKDAFNRIYEYVGSPKKLPENGHSLHTTIDTYIQAILEDELQSGVEQFSAKYGTGIILDPRTGAIKAIANYPTYDPNYPGSDDDENRRNFAISDIMEPGSTFKLVTAIAAVEQGVVSFEEIFETPENGVKVIHGQPLRDHDPLGDMNFQEVIQKSSNIAVADIAMRLDKNVFYQYARNLGFGTPTNVDISGEESGALAKPFDWSGVSLPWLSHGYEVQTTPIQIAQAYAAFANGGTMMRPYVVERIEDEQGNAVYVHEPTSIRRVAKRSTIQKLLPVFESVVADSGTGASAKVNGLRIAGKTGTAKKVVEGRYESRYRGSFVGFFPVDDPKYVCLILLDEPIIGYGGIVAAPVFGNIAKRIAGLDGDIQHEMIAKEDTEEPIFATVPSLKGMNIDDAEDLLDTFRLSYDVEGRSGYVLSQEPKAGTALSSGEEIKLTLSETYAHQDSANVKEGYALVPDLSGMNIRQAVTLLNQSGLKTTIVGSGTVFAQYPRAGQYLRQGYTVTVRGKAKSLETLTAGLKK